MSKWIRSVASAQNNLPKQLTTEKYDDNGKGGYFRFDYDNNMSYRYILSITYTEMVQLNTYNPIYCNENKVNL